MTSKIYNSKGKSYLHATVVKYFPTNFVQNISDNTYYGRAILDTRNTINIISLRDFKAI
jgi:hypothetical protein